MGLSVITLGLLIFENESYSQNILSPKVVLKSGRPQDFKLAKTWSQPNVLKTLNDKELLKRYQTDREGIEVVVELVRDTITSPTNRNNPITPELKCLATLRYLATGKMQLFAWDQYYLGTSSDSEIIPPHPCFMQRIRTG